MNIKEALKACISTDMITHLVLLANSVSNIMIQLQLCRPMFR